MTLGALRRNAASCAACSGDRSQQESTLLAGGELAIDVGQQFKLARVRRRPRSRELRGVVPDGFGMLGRDFDGDFGPAGRPITLSLQALPVSGGQAL